MAKFKTGISKIKITPDRKILLIGSMASSTGIHDDLFANTLVLDNERTRLVIITMDLVGLDLTSSENIRREIEKHTGIHNKQIMLNCSHTHSAPLTIPWYTGWEKISNGNWYKRLSKKIVNGVRKAISNLQESTLFWGREPVQIGFNRRLQTENGIIMKPDHNGITIPFVDVLRIDNDCKKTIAVLFSYAAHPVIVHGASSLISADYPGYAVSKVKRLLGNDVIAMFAQGCGGNINAEPLRGGFKKAREAGYLLGQRVFDAIQKGKPINTETLSTSVLSIQLPFKKTPAISKCEKALKLYEKNYNTSWYLNNVIPALKDMSEIAKNAEKKTLKFEIQSFSIGDELCITGMTHEVFAEYQLWINEISPFKHNMVLGYTNGCESYIPCKEDFSSGGYEAASAPELCAALAYKNRLTLKPSIEKQIKKALIKNFNI